MNEYRNVIANIEYLMKRKGIRNGDMAKRVGICLTTFQNRKNRPELFTLEELHKIAAILNVPTVELFKSIF